MKSPPLVRSRRGRELGSATAGLCVVLALVTAACGFGPAPAPSSPASVAGGSAAVPLPSAIAKGAVPTGSPDAGQSSVISDQTAALAALDGYRATLAFSFDGTQAGALSAWSETWTLTASRSSGLRALAYAQDGLGGAIVPYAAFEATDGSAVWEIASAGGACSSGAAATGQAPTLVEPASMLPGILAMDPAGRATTSGIPASSFTFGPISLGPNANGAVEGGATIADTGGLLLAYDLAISGGHDVFDADTEGSLRWHYTVEPLGAGAPSPLPAGCAAAMPNLPVPGGAADTVREPGETSFTTTLGVDDVMAFYDDALTAAAYTKDGDRWVSARRSSQAWRIGERRFMLAAEAGSPVHVSITETAAPDAAVPSEPAPTEPPSAAMSERISQSLLTLLGTAQEPTALGSYHVVFHGDKPMWLSGAAQHEVTDTVADASGVDVHYVVTSKRGSAAAERTEGYHVGGADRAVKGGRLTDDYGLAYLSWMTWSLDLTIGLASGSMNAEAAGTADVKGRTAEVYRIRGDDSTGLGSVGQGVESAAGTVWVDQATGALLRAELAYLVELKADGASHGTAKGVMTLEVSKVGAVSVSMP